MAGDLQSLLDKINKDGVEKAKAEAEAIVSAARERAKEELEKAAGEAAKLRADAERDAKGFAERAAESVRQAARDTVLQVKDSVEKMLKNLLEKDVETALSDPATAAGLVSQALKELGTGAEVACGAKLAAALKAQLAGAGNFEVVLDESTGAGFSVRIDGGRVEQSFTKEIVAAELARRLRPDLAALLEK